LVGVLRFVFQNKVKAKELSQKLQQEVVAKFSWGEVGRNYKSIVSTL